MLVSGQWLFSVQVVIICMHNFLYQNTYLIVVSKCKGKHARSSSLYRCKSLVARILNVLIHECFLLYPFDDCIKMVLVNQQGPVSWKERKTKLSF